MLGLQSLLSIGSVGVRRLLEYSTRLTGAALPGATVHVLSAMPRPTMVHQSIAEKPVATRNGDYAPEGASEA